MAKLIFSKAPNALVPYTKYKRWLEDNQYYNICGYCMTYHDRLDIDHFEPRNMPKSKADHPDNLLLACSSCNGPAGKSDYHPKHASRRRFKEKKNKFKVINPRNDNYANLFVIKQNGEIYPKPGRSNSRAIDNILLLKLDRISLNNTRKDFLNLLDCAYQLQAVLNSQKNHSQAMNCLSGILDQLNRIELFFRAYNIKLNRAINRRLSSQQKRAQSLP